MVVMVAIMMTMMAIMAVHCQVLVVDLQHQLKAKDAEIASQARLPAQPQSGANVRCTG